MNRPIIFFDLETTGVNIVKDRIVQIGAVKVDVETGAEIDRRNILINPGMPIPTSATEIHKITDDMVRGKPRFDALAKSMFAWFDGCDLGGHNICNFDVPMIAEEFARCDLKFPTGSTVLIDTLKLERLVNSHKLENCFTRHTGRVLEGAHDAVADADASMKVFMSQWDMEGVPDELGQVEMFSNNGNRRIDLAGKLYENKDQVICFAFGKAKGTPVFEDRGYAEWMLKNDFPADTKDWIRELLKP